MPDMTDYLEILPEKGEPKTLYLYLFPQVPPIEEERWYVRVWDGKQYLWQGSRKSLEELRVYADDLSWAKGWPRVECCVWEELTNPCVRVEFEYEDGRIQRLTGSAAEKWLKDVNGVLAAQQIRYGCPQVPDYPWEFSKKGDV